MWKANPGKGRLSISIFPNPSGRSGFTLVELIVVIAIIIVVASLAIPFALRARLQSNEAATVGNLRTVSSSCEAFRTTQNPPAYPADFAVMVNAVPPYLDSGWLNPQRQGYNYAYAVAGNRETFSASATPRIQDVTGMNSYCVDHTGVIRRYTGGGAIGTAAGCNTTGSPI